MRILKIILIFVGLVFLYFAVQFALAFLPIGYFTSYIAVTYNKPSLCKLVLNGWDGNASPGKCYKELALAQERVEICALARNSSDSCYYAYAMKIVRTNKENALTTCTHIKNIQERGFCTEHVEKISANPDDFAR